MGRRRSLLCERALLEPTKCPGSPHATSERGDSDSRPRETARHMRDSSLAPGHSAPRERTPAQKSCAAWGGDWLGGGGGLPFTPVRWVGRGRIIGLRAVIPQPHVMSCHLCVKVPFSLSRSLPLFPALSQSTPPIIINIINNNERQVIKCKICSSSQNSPGSS